MAGPEQPTDAPEGAERPGEQRGGDARNDLVHDLMLAASEASTDPNAAAPKPAEAPAASAGPPPLPKQRPAPGQMLILQAQIPTQVVRAEKVLERAREIRRLEQALGKTTLIERDAEAEAARQAAARERRKQLLKHIAGAALMLIALVAIGSAAFYGREGPIEEAIEIPTTEAIAEEIPEEIIEAPPKKEAPAPALVDAVPRPKTEAKAEVKAEEPKPAPVVAKIEPKPEPAKEEPKEEPKLSAAYQVMMGLDAQAAPANKAKRKAPRPIRIAPVRTEQPVQAAPAAPQQPPSQSQDAPVQPAAPTLGYLVITSDVLGVAIEIFDVRLGVTPLPKLELDPGPYTIWASKPGYEVFMQDIVVTAGNTTRAVVKMVPIVPLGGGKKKPR